jgi:ketosteroid isomerase-like protein
MTSDNVSLVRRAYDAYAQGDLAKMLSFVDPSVKWTYFDPNLERPRPQVCHGRHELESFLHAWAHHGLQAELEEIEGSGDRVMVGVRTPGIDAFYGRQGDDRGFSVLTVRDGRIVALRDCWDRQEARRIAGIEKEAT